ncbi:hypothetical protein QBC38DRAFT_450290 [Podospora fimiseda]|uniref:LIM zinc-binding domain-containing protein n=1 Tax=Podospora fimiseda TaxID=252190 RepID=A0AAN7BYW3_9PEZI|nr:hypothetical protein QBC38DRAFT_450290 [Podospora fimiseda]
MFARSKSKERSSTRKVTPPSPSYMSNEQFAAYLADLRNNRINRPSGARPLPPSPTKQREPVAGQSPTRTSIGGGAWSPTETSSIHTDNVVPPSSSRPSLSSSISSNMVRGRDYYPNRPIQPLKPSEVVPSATYMERGSRWMEKEEAVSLRQAMEDMDIKDQPRKEEGDGDDSEEKRLYNAALDEAAELVWQHQHPGSIPQPGAPYRYKSHLRKDSYAHARTASTGMYGNDVAPTGLARNPTSGSISPTSSDGDGIVSLRSRPSFSSTRQQSEVGVGSSRTSLDSTKDTKHRVSKNYGSSSSASGAASGAGGRRRSSLRRNISGEVHKPFSGDQIWEEPDDDDSDEKTETTPEKQKDAAPPLQSKPRSPLNRVQFASKAPSSSLYNPPSSQKPPNRYEIHRNPPSQSRNPAYTTNSRPVAPVIRDDVPRKHGMEVRGDDIKQATSKTLKDRSPALPTPSAVSDAPGRPIVSFDKNWKPHEEATDDKSESSRRFKRPEDHPVVLTPGRIIPKQQQQQQQQPQQDQAKAIPAISVTDDFSASSSTSRSPARRRSLPKPPPPTIQVDGPSVPMISVSDDSSIVPSIVIEPDGGNNNNIPDIPIIIAPDDTASSSPTPSAGGSRRPLPTPQPNAPRIRQQPAGQRRGYWSPDPRPTGSRATACCHECGGPIEGRFVSLAGSTERFHPQCFTCYSCGTSLEALEISPEPDHFRAARLERIARRARGERLPETPGETMVEDGDERMRFYCHLDWHELFAPRCKHCKTPIMGEHVVALGAHWHFGHFFCAECGDPFEKGMTHIEKDGYAWCVGCQTKRTERRAPKCKRCKLAVIGQYIRALGGEWHDECFRCAVCGGGFDDGQIFPQEGRGVLCTGCMEAELKA